MSSALKSSKDTVELTVEAHIAHVAFNRPEVLNAVNTPTHLRLIAAAASASARTRKSGRT
jgi:enoyl-CoA hydratase/carnithine racemase